ncbi:uncharacterized protein N7483_001971 [Penicillium malachiteum]|uniref:uncharacterized protein n=1 Tax=Penicillium malachiteum TaxID=1324776 RepID=UPI002548789C|nr:uncharacterized protein N7483_001971 [Penicillium malachiteum]KAJ5736846.1 hypothetical protein N7483_001971 [Penicillium malachiteum]
MAANIVVAFDLYGTLLSTDSVAEHLGKCLGSCAQSVSSLWRRYQLEYTWRLNSMKKFEDFETVTRNALRHAVSEHGQQLPNNTIEDLMKAYNDLHTFPDVGPALNRITNEPNIQSVIFSNGTTEMIAKSVHSRHLSQHASSFSDFVSVDAVRKYKPSPSTYEHLAQVVGKTPTQLGEIWLISANPFDIAGARNAGLNAIWVDRAAKGWQDTVSADLKPTAIVHSLEQIVTEITTRQA